LIRGIGGNPQAIAETTLSSTCALPGTAATVSKKTPPEAGPFVRSGSMMPKQRDQQDDRQRHAKQPQQRTSREIHDLSSSVTAF
jgi:hypothetical protein